MKQFKYILSAIALVFLTTQVAFAQNGIVVETISGTVYESATGKPLAGAQVSIPGVTSAVTAENGVFTLKKNVNGAFLVVSAPGYSSKRVPVLQKTGIKVFLLDDSFKGYYEDVVMPLGMKNAATTATAISTHENRDDYKYGAPTVETILQSSVNGLNAVSRTGAPGAGANLIINGINSLNANSQPLIVVDGIPYDNQPLFSLIGGNNYSALSDIDVKDVENITVLKDGASIYGSKAANGVILINTKQAKGVATRIDFYAYTGMNFEPNTQYKMMDAWTYKSYLTDMLSTKGLTANQIQALNYINTEKPVVEKWGVSGNKDYYRYNQSTNWQKEVFDNSMNKNYHLNVGGGNDIALYNISVGYLGQGGLVKNTDYSRYTMRVNANIKMTDWFKLNANISFVQADRKLMNEGMNRNFNPVYAGLIKAPFTSANVYNVIGEKTPNLEDVDAFGISNPTSIIEKSSSKNSRYRFFGNMEGVVTFSKYLIGSFKMGLTSDEIRETMFMPKAGINHDALSTAAVTNETQALRNLLYQINTDARLSYSRKYNYIHDVTVNVGSRYQTDKAELDWGKGYNTASDEMKSLGYGLNTLAQIGGSLGNWSSISNYLNVDYGYKNRYFLSLNAALDGSSRFGTEADGISLFNKKFGLFPSLNGAWLLSSEKFMANQHIVDVLKLRAGYSITGNDDIGNYSARYYYIPQGLLGAYGLVRGNVPNAKLQWETNKKVFAGVDASFFKERLNISLDAYSSQTENLIALKTISSVSGVGTGVYNDGELQNTGLDLSVNARLVDLKDFSWDAGINVSTYKNKLLSMSTDESFTTIAGGTVRTKVGQSIGEFYGYTTNGVIKSAAEAATENLRIEHADGTISKFTAGDVKFIDLNHDNIINEKDMTVIGNSNPDFFGSFTNRFQWKRYSFNAVFSYSVGGDVYNAFRASLESMSTLDNQTSAAQYRWKTDGQETNTPKAVYGDPMGNARFSDRWIEDGSYLRLKSLTVAYDVPFKSGIVNSIQVYVTGSNLITFTKYLGYDPEFRTGSSPLYGGIDTGVSAQPRSVLFGIKVGL